METMKRNLLVISIAALVVGGVTGGLLALDASREAISFTLLATLIVVGLLSAWITSPPLQSVEEIKELRKRGREGKPKNPVSA